MGMTMNLFTLQLFFPYLSAKVFLLQTENKTKVGKNHAERGGDYDMMDLFEKIYTHPRGDEKGQDGQGDQGPKGPYGSGYNPGFGHHFGHQGRYGQAPHGQYGQ